MTAVDRLPSHLTKKGCYYEVSVFVITTLYNFIMAERVGFEPTVRCRITGFQDRLLKPLGHLSVRCMEYNTFAFYQKGVAASIAARFLPCTDERTDKKTNQRRHNPPHPEGCEGKCLSCRAQGRHP